MLALKGESSSPSTTLRTGMVLSVLASEEMLGGLALARCWGVEGNPGGDFGDRTAAGGATETRGGVQGAVADGAELAVVAVGEAALDVGGSEGAALDVGVGGAAFLTGGGGTDDDT